MRRSSFAVKLTALVLFLIMGTSSIIGFADSALSPSYGRDKILSIKARNSSSESLSVEALKNRIHNKNNVTQTTPEVKTETGAKPSTNNIESVSMIVSDARYYDIYDSTKENKKKIGRLKAYSKVKVLKVVGDYYKIDKGYVNKKALLSQQDYDKYTKRRGKLTAGLTVKSNASIDDIKVITERYTRLKGMELTFLICEDEYNINAITAISCCILESHAGESHIGRAKNNMFGIAAYDWDPFNCAKKFDTLADCLDYWYNLIIRGYINEGRDTLEKMQSKYCTNPRWASMVHQIEKQNIQKMEKANDDK